MLELTQQLASLHEEQERLYAQWEQLQEQLEADDNARRAKASERKNFLPAVDKL